MSRFDMPSIITRWIDKLRPKRKQQLITNKLLTAYAHAIGLEGMSVVVFMQVGFGKMSTFMQIQPTGKIIELKENADYYAARKECFEKLDEYAKELER